MPRGHSLGIYALFGQKENFNAYFLGKRRSLLYPNTAKRFFSYCNLFLGKFKEKLARKARLNTDASILDRPHGPWASHNTP